MSRRFLAHLGFVGLVLTTSVVRAHAQIPQRQVGVAWRDHVPTLHFGARDMADARVQSALRNGLPQRFVMRIYAYRANGQPVAVRVHTCRVAFDLWRETFRVEISDGDADRAISTPSLSRVLRRCLTAERVAVGGAADYRPLAGEEVYFAVLVEFNPLSPETVHRLRRWLARPAGGGRVGGGDAFFGSFVSLFVNRRIGSAERTLRFRSPTVRVPR